MKKREVRGYLASLIIMIMVLGQVLQAYSIEGFNGGVANVLPQVSPLSLLDTQLPNEEQDNSKQQSPVVTLLPDYNANQSGNEADKKEGLSSDLDKTFLDGSDSQYYDNPIQLSVIDKAYGADEEIDSVLLPLGKEDGSIIIKEAEELSVTEETYGLGETKNVLEYAPLSAGDVHCLQVKRDGTVWACGWNGLGQLGDGTTTSRTAFTQVKDLDNISAVSAGTSHSIALKSDGTVWTWGSNNQNQLGITDEGLSYSSKPLKVQGLSEIVSISAGYNHNVALKKDGTVWTWGDNLYGQIGDGTYVSKSTPARVERLTDIIAISAGEYHNLALKSDGTVWAWGKNYSGQLGNGTTSSCPEPVQITELSDIENVAAGGSHSLAVKSDGTVWAWGYNFYGQLGDGTDISRTKPVLLQGLDDVYSIQLGNDHSLALKNDGTVWAWGANWNGQLGDGTKKDSNKPVLVKELRDITAIAAGYRFSLAQNKDGELLAWGYNYNGQLGNGTADYEINIPTFTKDITPPTKPTDFSAIVENGNVVLKWTASKDGDIVAGYKIYRDDKEIGDAKDTNYTDIGVVLNKIYVYKVKAYDASGNFSEGEIVVVNDNELPTAPQNLKAISIEPDSVSLVWDASTDNMQLGGYEIYRNGKVIGRTSETNYTDSSAFYSTYVYTVKAYDKGNNLSEESNPVNVTTGSLRTVPLAAGGSFSLQVKSDGTVWAWGKNQEGQLGDGTDVSRNLSMQIKGLNNIVAVAGGEYNGLALESNGDVWCWGANWLENDRFNSKRTPIVKVNGVIAIASGSRHNLALKSDGTVWVWGSNQRGQFGDGTTQFKEKPVKVKGLNGIIAIAAGGYHSLALKDDGTVWSWGVNNYGQLGNGTTTDSTNAVQVGNLSEVTAIAAGGYHSLALKNDGTVWAWGYNSDGQLGNEATKSSDRPIQVNLSEVTSMAAGWSHSLALKDDGTVWIWGDNWYGQLGNGTTKDSNKPVQVGSLSGVTAIAAGENHNIILRDDGTVWAWGYNYYGQLGNGTKTDQKIPIISKDEDPPTKPTNLLASIEDDKVILTWSASTDGDIVAGYDVFRDDNLIERVTETTYIDTDVTLDKIHIYKVRAHDYSGNTSEAECVVINDTEAPSALSNLTLVSQSATIVSLKWEASSDNIWVEGYEIYRNDEKIGETKDTEYTDITVPHNKTHFYTVKAFDKSSNLSKASNVVTVTTKSLKSVPLAAGDTHSLQVLNDGTVWAWGNNSSGQLGDGSNKTHTTAIHVEGIQDVVAVAAGSSTSFALKNDGTVWAWGYNNYGQLGDGTNTNKNVPTMVKDLYGVVALATGRDHVMALKEDGTVWTWGYNRYGQLGDETIVNSNKPVKVKNLNNVVAIAAGSYYSIVLKNDGTVWAWGENSYGQLGDGTTENNNGPVQVLELSDVVAIAARGNHSLALKKDGTIWAWGYNSYGQLGNGKSNQSSKPVQVENLNDVTAIAAGSDYSLALNGDGEVWSWGKNRDGQLGNGTNTSSNIPIHIVKLNNVINIAAGESHGLALKNNGEVWSWGDNWYGQIGDGTVIDRYEPVLSKDEYPPTAPTNLSAVKDNDSIMLSWTASKDGDIVTGYDIYRDGNKIQSVSEATYIDTGLDLDEIHVYKVIGRDRSGNMSEAATAVINDSKAPSDPVNLIVTSQTVTTVSLEWQASTDNVWVEGYDIYRDGEKVGNTKDTKYTDLNVPHDSTHTYTVKAYDFSGNYSKDSNVVSVTTEKFRFVSIEARASRSIALRNDGTVWVWGNDYETVAEQVKNLSNVTSIAAGNNYYLALKSDGTVWAWGKNSNGQLGDGTNSNKTDPVQVKDLYDVKLIAAGESHSLALKYDGTVWSWGYNSDGQLGNGTKMTSFIPVQVQGLSDVIFIKAGSNHSLAIKKDGTVWAWGNNFYGQLGDGSKENKISPVKVEGIGDVKFAAAGSDYSSAIKNDGTVWTWGNNYYGQLGDGTNISKTEPVMVQSLKDISSIAAGGCHSIAIKSDGTVWTWGENYYGQLGDGTTINRNTPVRVEDINDEVVIAVAGASHSMVVTKNGDILAWGYNFSGQLGNGTRTNFSKPVLARDVTPPTKPENVSATINSIGSVVLSWNASYDEHKVSKYIIYRNGQEMGTATWTNYKDTVTELDKIYIYEVIAVDASGNLSEAESVVLNDTEPPSAPLNLRVTSQTITSVSLEWEASTDNLWVEGYEVYRNGDKIGDTKDLSFVDMTVPHNTTHTYIVRSYDKSSNLSEERNELKVKTGILKSVPLAAEINSLHVQKDGTVWAWGSNSEGLLGDGLTKTSAISKQVEGIYDVVAVTTGNNYNLALKNDGTVWGWSKKITKFTDMNNVIDISLGKYNRLALRSDGTVWYLRDKSEQVKDISGVVAISAKEDTNLALKSDGTVWTFGNENVKIENLDSIIAISAGKEYNLALKSDGTVWTWANSGAKTARQIEGLNNVSKISAGTNHYLALKSDGTVFAWGNNYYGQLGDGTNTSSNTPIRVKSLDGVTAIAAGNLYSLALKSDGSIWAWGYNSSGQLGDGTTINKNTPVNAIDTTAPTAPKNLVARSTDAKVLLTWTESYDGSGVAGYKVYRNNEIIKTVTETFYEDIDIVETETYEYAVRAFDAFGNISDASNSVVNDTELPTTPKDFVVASKTLTSITLTWTESEDNVAVKGYEIYRDGKLLKTDITKTSYVDTGLNPDTLYVYTIIAYDTGYNYSLQSVELKETTHKDVTAPTVPQNLYIYEGDGSSFNLKWSASTDDAWVEGYEIYRNGVKVGEIQHKDSYGNYIYYKDTGVSAGITYVYTVRAYDSSGNTSLESVPFTIADDYGNTMVTAAAIQVGNEIPGESTYSNDVDFFSFIAPIDGVYTITCNSERYQNSNMVLYDEKGTAIDSYYSSSRFIENMKIEKSLLMGKKYYVRIFVSHQLGDLVCAYSLKVALPSDTEIPTIPTGVKELAKTDSTVTIGWKESEDDIGVAGYKIYRNEKEIGNVNGSSAEMKYTDTGLVPGMEYEYSVKAYDLAGNTSSSSEKISVKTIEDTTPPTIPTELKITMKTPTLVSLQWKHSTDNYMVEGYNIYRDGEIIGTTDKTVFTHNFETTEISCNYVVIAVDKFGNLSEPSNSVFCDNTPPAAVKDIVVVSKSASTVVLNWEEPEENVKVSSYQIFRNGEKLGDSYTTNFKDTSLQPQTEYAYTVKAVDDAGNISDKSDECKVTTDKDTQAPKVPIELKIIANSPTSITLSWIASTDDVKVAGYYVFRDGEKLDTTADTNYTDSSLNEDIIYSYTVRAFDTSGNISEDSISVSIDRTPPSKPENLAVISRGPDVISISWSPSKDNVEVLEYDILRDGKKIGKSKDTYYKDEGLSLNKKYSYTVVAYDTSKNMSIESDSLEVTTTIDNEVPSIPTGLKLIARTGSTVTIEWIASTDNTGVGEYEIYRDEKVVGVSRTTLYTDTGLTAGTSYSYAVKALDASKNRSEASNIITATPLNPEIVKVTPSNLAQIGGSINQELRVYFATSGSRAVEKVTFEYSTDDSDWTTITDSITGPVLEDSSTKYFSCLWDIRTIKTGKYKVRYTIYDEVGIGASVITSYDVDRDVPSEPKNLKALLVNDAVELKWECPLEADVIGYKIYRSESETDRFVPIAEAEGRTLSSYMDYSVKDKMTYYYKVTAIDRFKQESEFSNVTAISVNGVDSVKPVVRSIKAKNGNVFSETANLVVEAEDNIMVSRITVQYSVDNGQTWVDAASKLTQGSGSIELKWTTPDVNGEILVRAIAVDMAGNESDGTPVYKFKVDRQGPGKIEDLSAVEYANTVVLRWKHVAEEDFSHFEVERKDSKNGVFKSVGTVKNTLGMQINGLSCDTTYWFRVCAYDIYGNKGTYSDEIVVKTLLDTSAPVIYYRGSAPGYYNEKVILSADIKDNTGVEKIVFQISTDNEVWSDITTIEPKDAPENTTVNYEMDVSKMVEGTYYVRGIATDILGNTTSEPFFIEYRIDHTIPAQPENFAATPSYSKIKLEWDKGEENDLACYKLYRSTEKDGKYDVVHGTVMTLGYIDSNVKANTKYYYKVVSVDFAGNESPASGPVSCVLLGSDDDTEKPIIHAISPNKETMLPPNPSIGVSVEDNYIVKTVTLKYQIQEDSTDEWKLIGSKEVNKYGDFVSFTWDTTGLSDGNYIVKAVAVDEAGNKSDDFTANYKLNIEPPAAPTLTAVPGDFKVELSWQCGEEEDIGGFLIYRSTVPDSISDYICINGTRERSYTDEYVEAGKTYYYMIKAVDIRGNFSWSSQVKAIPTGVDTVSPVAEAGEDQKAVIGMEIEFDGSSSYDNNCIERYEWDFGDGNTANTVRAIHTYEKIGTYDVKLTVYDPAGNVGSTAIKVYILPDDEASTLEVEIVDELSGAPVSDARVLVQHIDGKVKEYVTDSQGLVKMVGTEGTYKIFAYKQGHSSSEGEVTLLRGSSVKKVICLKDTPVVIGELKVKRMTFEEIVNAGVDVNDPENQWVYECNIVLGFRPVTLTVNGGGKILSGPGGYHGPGGDYWRLGGGYGYGDYYVCPQVVTTPNHPEVPPTIYYLVIPAKVGWFKEFFEVSLIMQNTAEKGSAFTITNATAELQAPEGLTFIPSNYSRSTKVDMESIEPGETKEAKWVLRGDQKGEYILKAEFEGILQPFGELINSVYMTQEPVKVWGDDALVMHVKAEDYAFINELYLAKVELENVSDAELYNVSFEVKEGEGYVFPPEFSTSETYDVIKPGEKKVFEIWVLPNFTGVLDLSHSFIVKTGGNATIKTTLTSIPAPKARFEVNAETIFDEVTEDNYYTYKIVANVSNLRDIAGNVKAELEWIKTEGVKDIEISEAEVQELGDMIAGAERCLVWSVKFKAVSKTANIQYAIKVSGNNARSKKVEGSINAGDADFRIWLYNNEKEDPDYEDNIRYFTIGVRIYNDGGIAKNAKAELKIFSEYGENIVKVLTPKVQDLGSFSKWEYTEWELEVEKNVKTLRYQVAISADNAESVTAEGDLFIEEQEPKPLDLERFYYNPNQYYKDLALRAAEYAMLAYDDYAWSEKNGTYYTKKPDERDLIPKLLDDKLIEHNFIDVKICNYADSLENNVSFVIANKYVDYFGSKRNLTAVIIRGTDEVEWFGNMDVTGREYQDDLTNHWSFESGKDSVLKELRIYLKKHEIEDPLLLITGHSRGAAAANLLAEHIIRLKDYDSQFNGIDDSIFNDSDVSLFNDSEVFAYTFATPNTTKSPNKNLSIFNFRIMDDFVPQVPLEAWEYGQHGVTFSTIAQKLYKNDVLFSIQVDRYVNASGGKGKANYDYNKTQFILKYVGAVWKNVELYYKKSVYIENLFYPNQTIYDMTLYAFFRNVVARAAIKDLKGSVDIVFKLLDNRVFAPIAEFFITGNTIVEYVNDAHQMFSYYAALKNDGFVLDEPEGVNLQSFAFHDDSIVIKSAPKYESKEVEKLKNFAQQGDNLKRLGWDLEDASTWNGVKWSNNDQSRVIDIILSYKGLTGKLDLSEFSELQNLDISGNMITSIDLSKCTSLIDVDCSHNELTELILTDSSMLSILNCSWNGIQTLDISKCSNIQKLYCNNNKLSSLDLSSNSRLTELYCGYNDLETINLSSNTLLDTVSCEYNKFDIQEDSFMYKAMKSIEEKKNSWVVFEPQKMPEHPVFNSEDISKILDFVKQEDNSSKLEWDLSQPENWYGIEWYKAKNEYRTRRIEIDNLNLTGKLNFSNMPYLEYLSIRNNQIDEVNISGCKSLKFLDVHNSSLKRLDISNCSNITRLECEKNYLQINNSELLNDISRINQKEDSIVNYSLQMILAKKDVFNQNEYRILVQFANVSQNISILNWDVNKPGEWPEISWEMYDGEYRVTKISFKYMDLTGKLDVSSFDKLTDLECRLTKITSILLPNSLIEIKPFMFYDCSELTEVVIPNGVICIGEYAFYNCKKLSNIIMPDTILSIGRNAFRICKDLNTIVIPSNVSAVSDGAFYDCKNLSKAIFLGNAPDSFGYNVFSGTKSDFMIIYKKGASGFDKLFNKYNCEAVDKLPNEIETPIPGEPTPTPTPTPTPSEGGNTHPGNGGNTGETAEQPAGSNGGNGINVQPVVEEPAKPKEEPVENEGPIEKEDPAKPSETPVVEPKPVDVPAVKEDVKYKVYIRGYQDNSFRPENNLTRAEMAVILANLDGVTKDDFTSFGFTDVKKEHWAAWAISYVTNKGYFKGYNDNTFRPDKYITRAELSVVICKYLNLEVNVKSTNTFPDISRHWALDYINKLVSSGYIKGYPDGSFKPDNNIKRSECVTLINRALGIKPLKDLQKRFIDVDTKHWAFGDIMAASGAN